MERSLVELIKSGIHPIGIRNKGPKILSEVERYTLACTGSLAERLYWIKHDLTDYPSCNVCGTKLTSKSFKNGTLGYHAACSKKCSAISNQPQIKNTSLSKYGTEHPLKAKSVQDRRKATNLLRYGDSNPIRWSSVLFKNKMIERYGADHPLKKSSYLRAEIIKKGRAIKRENYLLKTRRYITEAAERGLTLLDDLSVYENQLTKLRWKCVKCNTVSLRALTSPRCESCDPRSKPERWVVELLREFLPEDEIIHGDRKSIGPQELDVFLPKLNLGFEINGVYWHSSKFKDVNYHVEKKERCRGAGIRLIQLWDFEILNQPEKIRSKICHAINRSSVTLNARDGVISEVPNGEAREFIEKNHLQGHAAGAILNLGLYVKNELVALMTFSKPRFNKRCDWELLRSCSKLDHNVRGGASKILSYFKKLHPNTTLISYSDRRYSDGEIYQKLGMTLIKITSPGYFYFNSTSGEMLSRYQAQKHKLSSLLDRVDLTLTEEENLKNNGFYRVYDCGQSVFELKITSS